MGLCLLAAELLSRATVGTICPIQGSALVSECQEQCRALQRRSNHSVLPLFPVYEDHKLGGGKEDKAERMDGVPSLKKLKDRAID